MTAKTFRWLAIASASMAAIAFATYYWWPHGKAIADILLEAGYLEMIPPSKFHGPGTLNTVEYIDEKKVQLYPTCEFPSQILSEIRESKTTDRNLLQLIDKKLDISAQIKKFISSEAEIHQIEDISLTFKNVRILAIPDDRLLAWQKKLLSNESCAEAVQVSIENDGVVCQARAVLQADVSYDVTYKTDVSVSEKSRGVSNIAGKQDLAASKGILERVSGRDLFFGIKLFPRPVTANTVGAKLRRKCRPQY